MKTEIRADSASSNLDGSKRVGTGDLLAGLVKTPPIVRNNVAGFAEAMMLLHFWISGAATISGRRWPAMALLFCGWLWLLVARKMRERFAIEDASANKD
jgi:hypothetical protein